MRKHLVLLLLVIVSVIGKPSAAQPVKRYYFTHYSTESGLLSNEVSSVLQDADGFIWTATSDGLQRFDGTRFITFRHDPNDPSSIPSNNILQLKVDGKHNLWVLTGEGRVGIFDGKTFRFRETPVKVSSPESLKAAVRRLITDDHNNVFLLLAGSEVLTWNEKKNELSSEHNFFTVPPGTGVADFIQQPGTHHYWISLREGVAIYNQRTRKLSYPGNNTEKYPAVEHLAKTSIAFNFHFDKKGRCWFQSWQPGLPEAYCYELNNKAGTIQRYEFLSLLKTYYETYRFYEQQDGSLWVTGLGLFARFLEDEKRFQLVYNGYMNERSIVYERVTTLAEDREKNIWVATGNNGLYRFNPSEQYFTNITHTNRINGNPGRGSIMSFLQTKWGTILAGSWGEGIYQYDRDLNLIPLNIRGIDNKRGPTVWNMYASADSNTVWMAAQPGLYALNQATRSVAVYNPPVLENRTIRQVVEDQQGDLWLGMNNIGVFRWAAADKKAGNDKAIKRFDKVPAVMINKITVDHKGFVWIGTATNGLYVADPVSGNIILHFSEQGAQELRLPEQGISSVLDYDDSSMLITTSRYVVLYNRYSRTSVLIGKADMMQGFIASMEKDRRGYVWIGTTHGIYRVNIRNRVFVSFNRNDGIDNDRFVLSSSRVLQDGRILFGSSEQFIVFDPAAIIVSTTSSQPRITGFKVMNKSLLVDSLLQLKQAVLRYNNNSLVIEFSPLVYSSAYMIKYKLDGLDKEWKMADKTNQAVYTYLPPGKYSFLMATMDAEAKTSENIITFYIRVNPPFWKSWWFFSLLAVMAGFFLFWFDRERMKRKEALQKMRSDIADNLHTEVNTALNNINILSEMARLKADKDPEKSKEYIEQIHTKSHNMIIAMDDMLWSLDPDNDSMAKTTDRMREYIEALKNRYGVNIHLAVDRKVETMQLNMKLRHEAFLLFKEGIKNLVTVGANNLQVYISNDGGTLLFNTKFDSEYCDMQQLNNLLHRQDLEKRLSMMSATIDVDLHKTRSAISLYVPVI